MQSQPRYHIRSKQQAQEHRSSNFGHKKTAGGRHRTPSNRKTSQPGAPEKETARLPASRARDSHPRERCQWDKVRRPVAGKKHIRDAATRRVRGGGGGGGTGGEGGGGGATANGRMSQCRAASGTAGNRLWQDQKLQGAGGLRPPGPQLAAREGTTNSPACSDSAEGWSLAGAARRPGVLDSSPSSPSGPGAPAQERRQGGPGLASPDAGPKALNLAAQECSEFRCTKTEKQRVGRW